MPRPIKIDGAYSKIEKKLQKMQKEGFKCTTFDKKVVMQKNDVRFFAYMQNGDVGSALKSIVYEYEMFTTRN